MRKKSNLGLKFGWAGLNNTEIDLWGKANLSCTINKTEGTKSPWTESTCPWKWINYASARIRGNASCNSSDSVWETSRAGSVTLWEKPSTVGLSNAFQGNLSVLQIHRIQRRLWKRHTKNRLQRPIDAIDAWWRGSFNVSNRHFTIRKNTSRRGGGKDGCLFTAFSYRAC